MSEELFMTTYKEISAAFQAILPPAFGGGRAELSLIVRITFLKAESTFSLSRGQKHPPHAVKRSGALDDPGGVFATYSVNRPPSRCLMRSMRRLTIEISATPLAARRVCSKESVHHRHHNKHKSWVRLRSGVTQMEPGVSRWSATASIRWRVPVILNDDDDRRLISMKRKPYPLALLDRV